MKVFLPVHTVSILDKECDPFMHALVEQKTCIRCGLCPQLCPDVFSIEDGESAMAITDPVPEDCLVAAQTAANSCPVAAIRIY